MLTIFCALLLGASTGVILGLIHVNEDLRHRHEILREMHADLLEQQQQQNKGTY